MSQKTLLVVLFALISAGCQRVTTRTATQTDLNSSALPRFEAVDSEGRVVNSEQLKESPGVVAFFDVESVLAWRTLSKLEQAYGKAGGGQVSLLGVGSSRSESPGVINIESLKKEYGVSFPIVFDPEKRISGLFQAPNCCDYLYVYQAHGRLQNSVRLSEAHSRVKELVADGEGPAARNLTDLLTEITVNDRAGEVAPLPVAHNSLTVVNLFDDFCADCSTGERLLTLNSLSRAPDHGLSVLAVFSDQKFSPQDIENFRSMLHTPYPLYRGRVEAAKDYMRNGRFLMVLDAGGGIVWHEKPGMSEREIAAGVASLLKAGG